MPEALPLSPSEAETETDGHAALLAVCLPRSPSPPHSAKWNYSLERGAPVSPAAAGSCRWAAVHIFSCLLAGNHVTKCGRDSACVGGEYLKFCTHLAQVERQHTYTDVKTQFSKRLVYSFERHGDRGRVNEKLSICWLSLQMTNNWCWARLKSGVRRSTWGISRGWQHQLSHHLLSPRWISEKSDQNQSSWSLSSCRVVSGGLIHCATML